MHKVCLEWLLIILHNKFKVFCCNVLMTRTELLSWMIGDEVFPLIGCKGKGDFGARPFKVPICNSLCTRGKDPTSALSLGTSAQFSDDFWFYGSPSPRLSNPVGLECSCSVQILNLETVVFLFESRFFPGDDVANLIRH